MTLISGGWTAGSGSTWDATYKPEPNPPGTIQLIGITFPQTIKLQAEAKDGNDDMGIVNQTYNLTVACP